MQTETNSDVETIREFINCWSTLDAPRLANYFTEDGIYYNMPAKPVAGRVAVEKFIAGFIANWTETSWEILNIAGEGHTVFCERLDKTKTQNGDVDLPCLGVFEMRDGKIQVWRDYFDMGTFMKAMS
ncbi:MAG: limonene-1,2-epoxide hydrolase [Limisphaerales bacterium]|jgi:limonene-1,2-epoxide hydrolase